MAKGRHQRKKTKPQVDNYKRVLNDTLVRSEDTTESAVNPALIGSDEVRAGSEDLSYGREAIARVPFRLAAKDWFRQNVIEIVVISILFPLFIWMIASIIDLQSDRKLEEYRITQVEQRLDSIDDDYVGKEMLSLQVESLKTEIDSISSIEVDRRIELLEKQINLLEKEIEKGEKQD